MNRLHRIFWRLAEINTSDGKEYRILPYLIQVLSNAGFEVSCDENNNIIGRRGYKHGKKLPILCAHSDTVNSNSNIRIPLVYNAAQKYIHTKNSSQVLGGDDKSGIAIILRLAEMARSKNLKFIAAFTNGEETGRGARDLNKTIYDMGKYAIVIDRRNDADVVTKIGASKLCSDAFSNWVVKQAPKVIKAQKISSCHSDASPMSQHLNAVNISCGYYDPHSSKEYVSVVEMYQTMLWVENMLNNPFHEISEKNVL